MSLRERVSALFKRRAGEGRDGAEDPTQTLDSSYERQLDLLQRVRRSVADVSTSRKRLQLQAGQLNAAAEKLEDEARQAVAGGREDAARDALRRRVGITTQLESLDAQIRQLDAEEQKLVATQQGLQTKVETFRARKETIKASFTAAEAQVKIGEAVSGISEEMGNVGLALERAEEQTSQMQARAAALDELLESGAVQDVTALPGGEMQAQLDRINAEGSIEAELSRIKGEVGAGSSPPAIDAGPAKEAPQ